MTKEELMAIQRCFACGGSGIVQGNRCAVCGGAGQLKGDLLFKNNQKHIFNDYDSTQQYKSGILGLVSKLVSILVVILFILAFLGILK